MIKYESKLVLLVGNIGCVDKDTEFFTGTEWKNISKYCDGDSVLQYNDDGSASLVKPTYYIKEYNEQFNIIETKYGVDMCFSDEHNHIYVDFRRPNKILKITSNDLIKRHTNNINGFGGRFINTFKYEGEGIKELNNAEIRLMVAVMADGSFRNKKTKIVRMNIKKDRKKERLVSILEQCNIKYKRKDQTDGFSIFYFVAPLNHKHYKPEYWYQANKEQLEIIAEECLYWDGSVSGIKKSFFTTNKESADFIQYVFTVTGHRSSIYIHNRVGCYYQTNGKTYKRKSIEYSVRCIENKFSTLLYDDNKSKCVIRRIQSLDGYKYCFTVPSGMLILRRNGYIFVTGNSGKSTIANKFVKQGYVCISRDALRYMIGNGKYIFDNKIEKTIQLGNILLIKEFMKSNINIVLDEINCTKTIRLLYINLAKKYNYKSIAYVLPRYSKHICVKRRMKNPHCIDDKQVWETVWDKFDRPYEHPTKDEGFIKIISHKK